MCEYCKAEVYVKTRKIVKSLLAPLTHIEELRQELEDTTGETYIKIPNQYCPMCREKIIGRRLGE